MHEVYSIDGDNVDMSSFFDENNDDGGFLQVKEYNGPPYDTIELQTEVSKNQLKLQRQMRIENVLDSLVWLIKTPII